jgi:GntR family transcriptional regulator, transcriptional repressor for pyruvate dehydrogenase complex
MTIWTGGQANCYPPNIRGPETSPFAAIQRRSSVAADAIEQITRLVTSGELRATQKLPPERSLSESLGVSRPTIREAVRALETIGVLETRQGSGTYVTDLSPERLARPFRFLVEANTRALGDLAQIRFFLEVGAAEVAARAIDEDALEELERLLTEMRDAIDDVERFIELDLAFHRVIHETGGNDVLVAMMESLSTLVNRSRMLAVQRRDFREAALHDHENIVRSLERRDPEGAAAMMSHHLRHTRSDLALVEPDLDEPA